MSDESGSWVGLINRMLWMRLILSKPSSLLRFTPYGDVYLLSLPSKELQKHL